MNRTTIRGAAIGITAGVTAGAVTVAAIIAIDTYDPLDTFTHALARHRLSPTDRAELDRLRTARETAETNRQHARDTVTAATRAEFLPGLLLTCNRREDLAELTVPALIEEIDRATTMGRYFDADAVWSGHLHALVNEFHRRRGWSVRHNMPELDQLRLEAAENHVSTLQFAPLPPTAIWQPPSTDDAAYPDFSGPYVADTAITEE